jgi:uncharacterized protein
MTIPAYPDRRPLHMADKPLLDQLFAGLQPQVSEFTFANLYLFRQAHAYTLTRLGEALVVFGQGYGGEPYFLPPLSGTRGEATRRLLAEGHAMYGVDDRFLGEYLPDAPYPVTADRDSFDYLYLRRELADLPGNRFHKKKNRISYFAARHDYTVEPYDSRFLAGCLELLAEWQRVRGNPANRALTLEMPATAEALELADQLGLAGVVVLVEERVKAFGLGERLNRDTAVCHFEKADPFLEGLPQLVNREFSRRVFTDCTYVNREQDLGEAGLREAKLSYHPAALIAKYRVDPAGPAI